MREDGSPSGGGRDDDGKEPGFSEVARYYDSNTLRFLLVGRGGSSYAIHRQLWGPGVATARDAADHISQLVAREIEEVAGPGPLAILDLGCGVGGTVFHLARRFPRSHLVGVTISRRQVAIANRLKAVKSLADRCRFEEGDFRSLRLDLQADVVVAVESFVHGDRPERFFAAAAAHLREGGHLILADDFLVKERSGLDDAARRRLRDFAAGWHVPGLCTPETCVRAAGAEGLEAVGNRDLTALIRLGRPRDRVIAHIAPLFRRLGLIRVPFFANMIGGDALQTGLREGFLSYRLMTFRKVAAA